MATHPNTTPPPPNNPTLLPSYFPPPTPPITTNQNTTITHFPPPPEPPNHPQNAPPKPYFHYTRRPKPPPIPEPPPPNPNPPPEPLHHTQPSQTEPTSLPHQPKPNPPISTHQMLTRSQTQSTKTQPQINFTNPTADPTTYKQAHTNPNWIQAMTTEINALHQQETWELVPKPPNQTVLGSKWTFKTKLNPDGTVSRYKARLVAQGFKQTAGIDYKDTFSPVAKLPTIRLLFILALQRNWNITQIDVSNAFLHGELTERVFMHQPKGFEDPQKPSHVCLLKKSLYGLKQSSRQWNIALTTHLHQHGFTMSTADPSLYILHRGTSNIYILIYVDDLLVTGDDDALISTVLQSLGQTFQIRILGPPRIFLGIQTDRTTAGFILHQHQYASSIVHLAGLDSCTAVSTPLPSRDTFYHTTSKPFNNPKLYRKIMGSL